MSADKLLAAVLATAASGAPALATNDLTTPVLAVQLTTVAGAILGTYAAIAYDEVPRPRGKLFALAIATTILASALVGWLPKMLGWTWSTGTEGALAALGAVAVYVLLPPAIVRGRELVRDFSLSDLLPGRKARAAADPTPPSEGTPEP